MKIRTASVLHTEAYHLQYSKNAIKITLHKAEKMNFSWFENAQKGDRVVQSHSGR